MSDQNHSTNRAPQSHIERLRRRSELLQFVRQWFLSQGYWEVETPLLSRDTCIDRWLEPFELNVFDQRCFLQTSPEFAMKKLLSEGADSIFQICKAFRSGESGAKHNPEFTMVEWYRCGDTLDAAMTFVSQLIEGAIQFAHQQGWSTSVAQPVSFQRFSYEEAFQKFASISAFTSSTDELLQHAMRHGLQITTAETVDRDDLLNFLLATVVEPEFESRGAVLLYDYPATQAALAQVRSDRHAVAERFELYLSGHELCNGYHELTDPKELRQRMKAENEKRRLRNLREFPIESSLIQAMQRQGLPDCSGVALGFDRLALICLGCTSLAEVLSDPLTR